MSDAKTFWDEKFAGEGYAYGTEPNALVAEVAARLEGPVLCLAEGEGRNAVYLARQGLEVTAVDASPVGLAKAKRLADRHGVSLRLVERDLADFDVEAGRWGAIVSIWAHVPQLLRASLHRQAVAALTPGGHFILEAYTPRQLAFGTGGPKSEALLMEPEALRAELSGLVFERLEEKERDVQEGALHRGRSSVVQVIARRPG